MNFLFFIFNLLIQISFAQSLITKEPLGLYTAEEYRLMSGNCQTCPLLPQVKWYFTDELLALPHAEDDSVVLPERLTELPNLTQTTAPIWVGSPNIIPSAQLHGDEQTIFADNSPIILNLVSKIPFNQDYWNASTHQFFSKRPIRLRGTYDRPKFTARTIWPLDFSIDQQTLEILAEDEDLKSLVQADEGGVEQPHQTRLLWEREPGAAIKTAGKPVLGLMLNGAQGDDHAALAGHFAVVTGRFNGDGSYYNWLVNNFYNLDSESEKGIIAAVTPMDNYLADLNSGQNYYRPSYMMVAVLNSEQPVAAYQHAFNQVMLHFYRHDFIFNHADANCTGISIDILRSHGWQIPERGINGYIKAIGAYFYVAIAERDLHAAREIYDYLTTETTRLLPAVAFDAIGHDLLDLANEIPDRKLTQFEHQLAEAIEAIWFVRIPQIPSSRSFGAAPVYSFDEYLETAPADRDDWVTIELAARALPASLNAQQPVNPKPHPLPWTILVILLGFSGLLFLGLNGFINRFTQSK